MRSLCHYQWSVKVLVIIAGYTGNCHNNRTCTQLHNWSNCISSLALLSFNPFDGYCPRQQQVIKERFWVASIKHRQQKPSWQLTCSLITSLYPPPKDMSKGIEQKVAFLLHYPRKDQTAAISVTVVPVKKRNMQRRHITHSYWDKPHQTRQLLHTHTIIGWFPPEGWSDRVSSSRRALS